MQLNFSNCTMPKSPLCVCACACVVHHLIIGNLSYFSIQLGFWKLRKNKGKCAACLCLLCYLTIRRMAALKGRRWPLPVLIPASQPVRHPKKLLRKGNNSVPISDYFLCPVLWTPAWPPAFLFFDSHLRHLSPCLGQPACFNSSTPWMSSFIHCLSPCCSHCAFFCWHN